MASFPTPSGSASLLLSWTPRSHASTVLIIGSSRLAASRAFLALDADASVVVSAPGGVEVACDEIRYRVAQGQVAWLDALDDTEQNDEAAWKAQMDVLGPSLSLVCVTDSILVDGPSPPSPSTSPSACQSSRRRASSSLAAIRAACSSLRLPLNVSDHPHLSDFSFPSSHRFPLDPASPSSGMSSLQIAVSTSGRGCRLANRLKRDVVARLPRKVGRAVENVGIMRKRARASARRGFLSEGNLADDEDLPSTPHIPLNSPVPQLDASHPGFFSLEKEDAEESKRRMRWVAQVSEYWPIDHLAGLDQDEMDRVLGRYAIKGIVDEGFEDSTEPPPSSSQPSAGAASALLPSSSAPIADVSSTPAPAQFPAPGPSTLHSLSISPSSPAPTGPQGSIYLLGSGPGHPSLLTIAAHQLLLSATLVLSDKLVPSEILALIPSTTTLHIAKKFPGNAEGAQNEMMALALEGARRGERVVRLKQGDPYVYGRGGEEVLFFREHGYRCTVVPGVSSALAGPLMFDVPVTQRGVADSLVLCTGVGRKGKSVVLPGYERGRTLLVLMGVARIASVLKVLQDTSSVTPPSPSVLSAASDSADHAMLDGPTMSYSSSVGTRSGAPYPPYLPIAIIERASSHDQRIVASTLSGIEAALERVGDQRPPGMMVIGWAALALQGSGDVTVLDDGEDDEGKDRARVERWLGGESFLVREGLSPEWQESLGGGSIASLE